MFAKNERLQRALFTEYFTTGRRFHTDLLTLIYVKAVPCKVAVVVGKKVSKKAVDRNRIRRRLYAALKVYLQENKITTGGYIVIAKPHTLTVPRITLKSEVTILLAQVSKSR